MLENSRHHLSIHCIPSNQILNSKLATTLAKQLVQLRKTKTRSLAASTKISAVGHQATAMQANAKMAGSMQVATKVMMFCLLSAK